MPVAGAQPQPVGRREVTDGVGHLGVLDELGPGGGPRGEVEEEGVGGRGAGVRQRLDVDGVRVVQVGPAVGRPDADPHQVGQVGELAGLVGGGDHGASPAARGTVGEVRGAGRGGRRHDDRADLHHGEHDVPQLALVAEHEQHRVTAPHAEALQPATDPVGAGRHGVEADLLARAVLGHDDEGRVVVAAGDRVEPVDRPVELLPDVGPGERGECLLVPPPQGDQLVTCLAVPLRRAHRPMLAPPTPSCPPPTSGSCHGRSEEPRKRPARGAARRAGPRGAWAGHRS